MNTLTYIPEEIDDTSSISPNLFYRYYSEYSDEAVYATSAPLAPHYLVYKTKGKDYIVKELPCLIVEYEDKACIIPQDVLDIIRDQEI